MRRSVIARTLFIAAALSCVFSMGCKKDTAPKAPELPEATVAKPIVRDTVFHAYYTGRLEAVASVDLRARVRGFLLKNNFVDGAFVKKNQVLFEIDPAQFQADVLDAKGKLDRAIAVERDAKFNYRRTQEAHAKNVATDNELMNALAQKDSSIANVESARAALEQAKINLGYTKVYSPINGQVSRHYVDPGNLVGAAENTLLGTVIQNDPIYVYFDVSGNDIIQYQNMKTKNSGAKSRMKQKATPVKIRLAGNGEYGYEGKIDYANIQINPNTQTLQLRGILPNKTHFLIPGMFADVQVPITTIKDALLIPENAIGQAQGGAYVLTLNEKNVVTQTFIKKGQIHGLFRVVLEGLDKDSRVIVEGIQKVRVAAPAKPKEVTLKYEPKPKGIFVPGDANIIYQNGEGEKPASKSSAPQTQPASEKSPTTKQVKK